VNSLLAHFVSMNGTTQISKPGALKPHRSPDTPLPPQWPVDH
jgi:hypothetical protein